MVQRKTTHVMCPANRLREKTLIIRRDVFLFALDMPIVLLKTLAKDEKSSLAFGIIQNDKHKKIMYIYINM